MWAAGLFHWEMGSPSKIAPWCCKALRVMEGRESLDRGNVGDEIPRLDGCIYLEWEMFGPTAASPRISLIPGDILLFKIT